MKDKARKKKLNWTGNTPGFKLSWIQKDSRNYTGLDKAMRDSGYAQMWGYSLWRTPCFSSRVQALRTPGQLLPEIERIWIALSLTLWYHSLFYRGSGSIRCYSTSLIEKERQFHVKLLTLETREGGHKLHWTDGETTGKTRGWTYKIITKTQHKQNEADKAVCTTQRFNQAHKAALQLPQEEAYRAWYHSIPGAELIRTPQAKEQVVQCMSIALAAAHCIYLCGPEFQICWTSMFYSRPLSHTPKNCYFFTASGNDLLILGFLLVFKLGAKMHYRGKQRYIKQDVLTR